MNEKFKPLIEDFIRSMRIRNLAGRTISENARKLNMFLVWLEKHDITCVDDITKDIVYAWQVSLYQTVNSRGRQNSASYQNSLLRVAKQFIRFLHEHDYIVSDPAKSVQYAKTAKPLPGGVLTSGEARKIIQAPNLRTVIGYRDRTILEVLYSSGIRKAEVINLTLEDADYQDGYLRIMEGKGKKDRIVPIGRIACRYLENYIKSVRPELIRELHNNYLFLSLRGNRLSANMVWELVKKYAQKAKIKKNVHPHTFRHTCATVMLKNKADLNTIRKILGHSSLTSTQVYTHLVITDLKEVHQRCHPREMDKD